MTTRSHTAISAGAAATAATINAPLGQLDAALNPTVAEYASTADTSTTVTTAGTYYRPASHEVSVTPAYAGQVFDLSVVVGATWGGAAGTCTVNARVTDGAYAAVTGGDSFVRGSSTATALAGSNTISGARCWTAAAGDVGVARKLVLFVTHTVNGTAVHVQYVSLQARYR